MMIIVKRRNLNTKGIIDRNRFPFFTDALKFLDSLNGDSLIEVKLIDGCSTVLDKQCFRKKEDAIKFLEEKNGEQSKKWWRKKTVIRR
jgi:hypothetical protein